MSLTESSWGAFSSDFAVRYLKSLGAPSLSSRQLLIDLLRQCAPPDPAVLDLGCGNAQLYEFMQEQQIRLRYTGVDISDVLLDVARKVAPRARFIRDDVGVLSKVTDRYDVAIYSHVLEMLESPERSLARARQLADKIFIRFFEPPEFEMDCVELREMEVAEGKKVPYLRRKMSRDHYRLILSRIGCRHVDVYRDLDSKDQVHVLLFG